MAIKNLGIRDYINTKGLTYKKIAQMIGVSPEYLSKCMRYPLKPEMEERIKKAIGFEEKPFPKDTNMYIQDARDKMLSFLPKDIEVLKEIISDPKTPINARLRAARLLDYALKEYERRFGDKGENDD